VAKVADIKCGLSDDSVEGLRILAMLRDQRFELGIAPAI
jgi:hypothetical protein